MVNIFKKETCRPTAGGRGVRAKGRSQVFPNLYDCSFLIHSSFGVFICCIYLVIPYSTCSTYPDFYLWAIFGPWQLKYCSSLSSI